MPRPVHLAVNMAHDKMTPTDSNRSSRVGADLLELIEHLQSSLQEAWREIQVLQNKVTALTPLSEPLTVEQLAERYPALTRGGIRWMLFHRDSNGLAASGAVIRRGRRIYLDETRFLGWFGSQGQQGKGFHKKPRRCMTSTASEP